jgi:hypothetical protein
MTVENPERVLGTVHVPVDAGSWAVLSSVTSRTIRRTVRFTWSTAKCPRTAVTREYVKVDICNHYALEQLLNGVQPTIVFPLNAKLLPRDLGRADFYHASGIGTELPLDLCKASPAVQPFFNCSAFDVYAGPSPHGDIDKTYPPCTSSQACARVRCAVLAGDAGAVGRVRREHLAVPARARQERDQCGTRGSCDESPRPGGQSTAGLRLQAWEGRGRGFHRFGRG